jgi:hypothetical protein
MHLKTVFVHLGPANATHLWANIRRFNKLFPNQPTAVILSNTKHIKKVDESKNEIYIYSTTEEDELILNNLAHNMNFRQGFWKYSIERFYALRKFHELNPGSPILHLESDVLVMPNFPFESFQHIRHLAWERFNETHDVSAIMYLNAPEDTKWLTEKITLALSESEYLTDMTALSTLSKDFSDKITLLPGTALSQEFNLFGGIFDAAPIGMWLSGRDPRNHRGFVKRFLPLPEAEVNASSLKYRLHSDGTVSGMSSQGQLFNIYDLHIHSKRLTLFGPYWKLFLRLDIRTSAKRRLATWFSPWIFFLLLRNYLIKKFRHH